MYQCDWSFIERNELSPGRVVAPAPSPGSPNLGRWAAFSRLELDRHSSECLQGPISAFIGTFGIGTWYKVRRCPLCRKPWLWYMLSVGIAQYPVPDFRLTEQRRGRVLDASSQASCLALLPRCQTEGGGPTEKPGPPWGRLSNGQKYQTNF
jgi:hypothetical protein